jgi:hypothetical protein
MRQAAASFNASPARSISTSARAPAADGAVLDRPRHRPHRLEITGAGDGKTGLDHVNPHPLQHFGDADFFFFGHRCAGLCSPSRKVVSKMISLFIRRSRDEILLAIMAILPGLSAEC